MRGPLVRRDGELRAASWQEAFAEVARRLPPIVTHAVPDLDRAGVDAGRCRRRMLTHLMRQPISPMMRVALHTRLKPGAEAAYEEAHRSVPEALTDAIRAAGVHSWTIWRSGPDLFHVIECDDYRGMLAELERLPVNLAWQARMAELLEVVHDYSGEVDAELPVVWRL